MNRVNAGSKLRMAGLTRSLPYLVWFLGACATVRRPTPADELPRRVVLALDGLDYRDVLDARQRGRFASFHPPARLVSTFPSISDIAWHAIFGVYPPPGYQRVYYSVRQNAVLGDALSAIRPIEYEERMDHAFDTKFHHLGAYLISWPVARREVDTDVEHVLRTRGRETVYLYNVGPDALQHTRGDVARYLDHLSDGLDTLQSRYRARTGRALEIVVLSDHGHNRARDAAFLPISDALATKGFHTARTISAPNRVAFSVDGVTTGFGVFCAPDSIARVASLIAAMDGVDVVSARDGLNAFAVRRRLPDGQLQHARIEWQPAGRGASPADRYRYTAAAGDPLELLADVERMRADGVLDPAGFAAESVWMQYTRDARYPAAVVRIVHGHTFATRNPAPILVSVRDDYRVGLGMVSVANRMRPLGGTHGALGASNAVGVVLSNRIVPHDDLAWRVREQFGGFDDLRAPVLRAPQLRIVPGAELRDDRFERRAWTLPGDIADTSAVLTLAVPANALRTNGDSVWVRFEVREPVRGTEGSRLLRTVSLPISGAWPHASQPLFAWPAERVGLTSLPSRSDLSVRVLLEFRSGKGTRREQRLLQLPLRIAPDGTPWSY